MSKVKVKLAKTVAAQCWKILMGVPANRR